MGGRSPGKLPGFWLASTNARVTPFTEIVNIRGGGLRRKVKKNSSILAVLSWRCLGAVQGVILSGQMDTYRSGAWD